jgi:hypothetical protein
MRMRRETFALTVLGILIVLSAGAFIVIQRGFDADPVKRSDQQNLNTDAPMNQTLSPGTVKDERGDSELPAEEQ